MLIYNFWYIPYSLRVEIVELGKKQDPEFLS